MHFHYAYFIGARIFTDEKCILGRLNRLWTEIHNNGMQESHRAIIAPRLLRLARLIIFPVYFPLKLA